MAGNANSGNGQKFRMSEKDFKEAVRQYKSDCAEGLVLRPSLSHFCGRLGTTEEYLTAWLKVGDNPMGAYYGRAEELKIFLTWLRGEMFSSGSYDGATAKKFVEMQLGKDYGDGVVYSAKADGAQGPTEINIKFGSNDKRSKDAFK